MTSAHWSIDEEVVKSYWMDERKTEMKSFNWWIFFTYDWWRFKRFYMIHVCKEKKGKTGQPDKQRYLLYVAAWIVNHKIHIKNNYKQLIIQTTG